MALPCRTTGSLTPAFAPARPVGLAVKLPCAFALYGWFPISLREPSHASVTFLEATAPVKLPTRQCPRPREGPRLGFQNTQGGISTTAPPNPEARHQSLPPILRRVSRKPLPSCSKGSWGLSVLPRVEGIFTPNTISLSPRPRQRGCCYAIRAGRNLPDKEFRYLRTVIVTAAVYWGFGSELRLR
jgi:hypothetical protein